MTDRVILTPAPGRVFLRAEMPIVEMTPGETLRLAAELQACARIALCVEDGEGLFFMLGESRNG